MAFSAVPAPLYVLYQARDHFGDFLVTVIFAAYAVGVMASLLLAGHLSDWVGRRRMMAVAMTVDMSSGLVFLGWPTVPGLLVGRVMCGISIGMLTATATAYLSELHGAARPGAPPARAEIAATAANLGGLGLGTLLAGVLTQYAADPLRLPYAVSEALMLVAVIALVAAPETVARRSPRPRYRPQRVSVPPADRRLFYAAGFAATAEFALVGGGAGTAFKGSVSTVIAVAPRQARGEALAGLFLAAYIGLAVPVVALGVATQLLSTQLAVLGFAAVLLAVVGLVSSRLLSQP